MTKHDHKNKFIMRHMLASIMGALVLTLSMSASAQWQWVDSKGVTHFSDSAPPPSIPDKDIIRKPGERTRTAPQSTEPVNVNPAPPAAPPELTANDRKLEAERLRLEAEKEKAEAERKRQDVLEKQRACDSAKLAVQRYTSGLRIRDVDEKGGTYYLTSEQIAQRLKDAQANVKKLCEK